MALADYLQRNHPEIYLETLTYWDTGEISLRKIYPEAVLFTPKLYREILDDEDSYLPQVHLHHRGATPTFSLWSLLVWYFFKSVSFEKIWSCQSQVL
jgi:membrane-bound metal-dependent hydrolase YbcI (DUF457 family)